MAGGPTLWAYPPSLYLCLATAHAYTENSRLAWHLHCSAPCPRHLERKERAGMGSTRTHVTYRHLVLWEGVRTTESLGWNGRHVHPSHHSVGGRQACMLGRQETGGEGRRRGHVGGGDRRKTSTLLSSHSMWQDLPWNRHVDRSWTGTCLPPCHCPPPSVLHPLCGDVGTYTFSAFHF